MTSRLNKKQRKPRSVSTPVHCRKHFVSLTVFPGSGGVIITKQSALPVWSYSQKHQQLSQQALETALNEVPFYQKWKPLDPGTGFQLEERYAAMPVLTKKDIREHFPLGMLPAHLDLDEALKSKEISLVETSGTTDEKITNIWNQKWWDASEAGSWHLNAVMSQATTGQFREAILVNPKNVGIKSDEFDLPMEKRQFGRFLYLNEKTDPLTWSNRLMDRMTEEINRFKPAVLEANPAYLAKLCRHISAQKIKIYQPQAIVFTYEYSTHFHRRQIQEAFQSPLISSYGTTETGYVFMQCEKGKLHQNNDFCHVSYQPFTAEQGGPLLGRILVTPLGNPWSYYLRFDTGDIVRLESSGRCECGRSSGMILAEIAGRTVNLTLTTGGRPVTLSELDNAVSALEGVVEYQMVQPEPGDYNLILAGDHPDKTALSQKAAVILRDIYGRDARINIIFTDAITPEASGKYLISRALFPIDPERYLEKMN